MHSDGKAYYPTRSFIRFQAKSQLIAALMEGQISTVVNPIGPSSLVSTCDCDLGDQANGDSDSKHENSEHYDENRVGSPSNKFLLDETLFAEIAATTFHQEQHPELYQSHSSRQDVTHIEEAIATEIVSTYKRILTNRADQRIQNLNALL